MFLHFYIPKKKEKTVLNRKFWVKKLEVKSKYIVKWQVAYIRSPNPTKKKKIERDGNGARIENVKTTVNALFIYIYICMNGLMILIGKLMFSSGLFPSIMRELMLGGLLGFFPISLLNIFYIIF